LRTVNTAAFAMLHGRARAWHLGVLRTCTCIVLSGLRNSQLL
jgi:hypothetical protein